MQNDKLAETVAEQGLKYGDMLRELGTYFLRNPKRFRFALKPHVPQTRSPSI